MSLLRFEEKMFLCSTDSGIAIITILTTLSLSARLQLSGRTKSQSLKVVCVSTEQHLMSQSNMIILRERKPRPREIMSYENDSFKSTAELAFTGTKNYKGN